jgi:multidrug efflux pump subunit AcrA (membrane-fusion protein)
MKKVILLGVLLSVLAAVALWSGPRLWRAAASPAADPVPTAAVRRGTVTMAITAKGDLQGGNSEMLTAPMTGGNDMVLVLLRAPGELVQVGDVVASFDTTEQDFKLKEAEADLAEAEQQVIQAQSNSLAKQEEDGYALVGAKASVQLAALEARKNPLMSAITAQQNTLAVEAAQATLSQIEQDLANRQATSAASIAIQEAARNKAKVQAETARRNIENMTLRAKTSGYVNVQDNMSGNIMYYGMTLPALQLGDTVRAGMPVAQIPDLKSWEISARIAELDRGHIAAGEKAEISIPALAGRQFTGRVKEVGGTTGPPWDRSFDCKLTLDNPSPALRPGMSATMKIVTGVLPGVLWVPSQALFESDGRTFVYLRTPAGTVQHDVKLVERSESQVVVTGVREGQLVSLASPETAGAKPVPSGGAMKALKK